MTGRRQAIPDEMERSSPGKRKEKGGTSVISTISTPKRQFNGFSKVLDSFFSANLPHQQDLCRLMWPGAAVETQPIDFNFCDKG
jgi:hypothetical protein